MLKFLTGLFAWFGGLFAARPKSSAATGAAAVLIDAAAFVGPWEGEWLEANLDRIASPPVWTVCYGETKGVKRGIAPICARMGLERLWPNRPPTPN
ncbi:hypothetical protein HOY34_11260 [Xinfangfangia sp. D13-10-4-6]|uniref:hypothetical protein n=1 Tax=Pseudogemmobacter hezensis TaxID=2737662 RepID=UPI0015536563|nr:hypothetical protein [Pseudogemmobacter hezensis]NPD15780.1 hypothetical protein [Pseudogemmobacter hezensis]